MTIAVSNIAYRKASAKDIGILIDYRILFLNETAINPKKEEINSLKKSLHKYFSKAIPSEEYIRWLAEYEGRILAVGGLILWQMPGRYRFENGKLGCIVNIYTNPDVRRLGIASQLLTKLIEEAKSLDLGYLHLRAHKNAENLYRKMGFYKPYSIELQLNLE
jgi:GNAT superfamily N-acetyltransferase